MKNTFIRELCTLVPGSISFGQFWLYKHNGIISNTNIVNKPGRLDAMTIIICSKGEIALTCNFRQFRLHENMVFISKPQNILNVSASKECEGYVIATEDSALTDYTIDPRHIPELLDKVYDSPMIQCNADECSKICNAIDMLCEYIKDKSDTPFKTSIIKSGINTFAYILADILYGHMPSIEFELKSMKREKEHFNKFISILSENYTREREVRFYADKMNLSPRYLTTTIRNVSGYTVSEWISRFVIKDAKYLLKHSDMTIQQVAYELNFPNQSFFGKYFKNNTGMSPGTYRNNPDDDIS